jgi:hypothetical protein
MVLKIIKYCTVSFLKKKKLIIQGRIHPKKENARKEINKLENT